MWYVIGLILIVVNLYFIAMGLYWLISDKSEPPADIANSDAYKAIQPFLTSITVAGIITSALLVWLGFYLMS